MGLGAAPALAQSDYATPYAITFFAGSGLTGSADGTGSGAQFNQPCGVALDASGNLYVADRQNNVIRKVTPAGVVTTLAGTAGTAGSTDGTGSAALFNQPTDVAVNSSGDVFVADSANNTIRMITPAGVVTTFAGSPGTSGTTDGTGAAALFSDPFGVAVDSGGNVYVADTNNSTVRKLTPAGVSTTLAGTAGTTGFADGTGVAATFNRPVAIAVDGSGNLYVSDTGNDNIRKITSAGVVTTLAGRVGGVGSQDGTGPVAEFNAPRGLAADGSGNIFVADSTNSTIRKVTPAGVVTTLAGTPGEYANVDGTGAAAILDVPIGVAVDGSGTLYVAEEHANIVVKGVAASTESVNITQQPVSQTIQDGSTVVFHEEANGLPLPTYQWYFNGAALSDGAGIEGSAGPTLVITGATTANAGSYSCIASNATGSAPGSSATLAVVETTDIGRLIDISCRSAVGAGNILIAGFAVGGAGTSGSEPLLIRASGPALNGFGITDWVPNPIVQLYAGPNLMASDAGWGGAFAIAIAAAQAGAFEWTSSLSLDSALLETLPTGAYSALITGQNGTFGVALAEIYDLTPAGTYTPASPRIINISARTQVGTGDSVLIAGFVIGGSTSRTVLIRASGPALVPFGVAGTLPDPELALFSGNTILRVNDGWGGDPEIANAASEVNAFAWSDPASNDSAIIVTLAPGAYTAQVAGASGDTGQAMVEVYEVP
jgi:sugar lactone lactonase YvrE